MSTLLYSMPRGNCLALTNPNRYHCYTRCFQCQSFCPGLVRAIRTRKKSMTKWIPLFLLVSSCISQLNSVMNCLYCVVKGTRVGVWPSILTCLPSYLIIWESFNKTMLKPLILHISKNEVRLQTCKNTRLDPLVPLRVASRIVLGQGASIIIPMWISFKSFDADSSKSIFLIDNDDNYILSEFC